MTAAGTLRAMTGSPLNTTNCHLYHYAGNNPVRYMDPEGKTVKLRWASEEEKQKLLSAINTVSKYRYNVSSDGTLVRDGNKKNGFFGYRRSQKISDALDNAISLQDKTITIEFSEMLINFNTGDVIVNDIHLNSNGGVTTVLNDEIQIHMSRRGGVLIKFDDGSMRSPKTVEEIFIHEFYGHAYPIAIDSNGNAVERENEIRVEMHKKKRKAEPSHESFYSNR